MKSNDLIDVLARDLQPVAPNALSRRLSLAVLPALVASAALIVGLHGLRPDLAAAILTPAFWAKSAYPFLLMVLGLPAMMVVARPGGRPRAAGIAALAVYIALVTVGLWQLRTAPVGDYPHLIFGVSGWFCPLIIIGTASPVLGALLWFLRQAAPTNLRLAGFVAGITAGAAGAWVYSWGCLETGLTFVSIWYTLGIVLTGLIGLFLGRRLLAW